MALSLPKLLSYIEHPRACNIIEKYLAFYCNPRKTKENETCLRGSLEKFLKLSIVSYPGEYSRDCLLIDVVHDIMLDGARKGLNVREVQHFVAIVTKLLMKISEENFGMLYYTYYYIIMYNFLTQMCQKEKK